MQKSHHLRLNLVGALSQSTLYNTDIKDFYYALNQILANTAREFSHYIYIDTILFELNPQTNQKIHEYLSGNIIIIFRGALPGALASYLSLRPLSILQDFSVC